MADRAGGDLVSALSAQLWRLGRNVPRATPAIRTAWVNVLDGIIATAPKIVVSERQTADTPPDLEAVKFTRDNLPPSRK